jgi:hypothetical protein
MLSIDVNALRWERRRARDEDYLIGGLRIGSVNFHAEAIRVHEVEDIQEATNDPNHRLDDLSSLCGDGAFETVEIDGFPGRWVVYITPFQC